MQKKQKKTITEEAIKEEDPQKIELNEKIEDERKLNTQQENEDELEKRNAKNFFNSIVSIFKLLEPKHKRRMFFLCCLAFVSGFANLVPAQVISVIISKITGDPIKFFGIPLKPDISFGLIIVLGGLVTAFVSSIGTILSNLTFKFSQDVVLTIKQKAFSWIVTPRKNTDIGMTQGDATYRINSSTDEIGNVLTEGIVTIMPGLFSTIMCFVYIGIMEPASLPVLAAGAVAIVILVRVRAHFERPLVEVTERENSRLTNYVVNALSNLPVINIFRSERHESAIFKDKCDNFKKHWFKRVNVWRWYWITMSCIQVLCTYGIIALCISRMTAGKLPAANIVIIISYVNSAFTPLQNFGWFFGMVIMSGVKIDRIKKMQPNEENMINVLLDNPIDERINKIEMKHVYVRNGIDVHIDDVNLVLEKGKLIVITGPSGGGKTTTIRTLLGLTERESGDIVINDKYNVHTLYSYIDKISVVMQSPYIFNRDVADNILYPGIVESEKSKNLISYLSMDEVFTRKFDEDCEQNLENMLSGGEKKRICVLRGLIPEKEMYIFDEPTNELDAKNTTKVLELIDNMKKNAIVVVVTHDKRMISQADQLIEISNKYASGAKIISKDEFN